MEGMICTIYYRGVFPGGGGGLKNPIFIDERREDIDKVFNGWIIIVF